MLLAWGVGWAAWSWFEEHRSDPQEVTATIRLLDELDKRAEKGDAEAEYGLARMYASGDGVSKNAQKARTWLERAAEHGHARAEYDLAIMLRDGRGTIQDHERAWKWMRSAAEGGNAQAQYELGLMYRAGTGVPRDDVKAYVWLSLAAVQEVPGAAAVRNAVLSGLSADKATAAQAEARRLSEIHLKPPATGN